MLIVQKIYKNVFQANGNHAILWMNKLFISTHTMKKKVYLHTIKNFNFNTFLIYFGQKSILVLIGTWYDLR